MLACDSYRHTAAFIITALPPAPVIQHWKGWEGVCFILKEIDVPRCFATFCRTNNLLYILHIYYIYYIYIIYIIYILYIYIIYIYYIIIDTAYKLALIFFSFRESTIYQNLVLENSFYLP